MCVTKDNSIGLLDFEFDLNWKPSSGVMFYRKKKKQQHNILNKKNQKKEFVFDCRSKQKERAVTNILSQVGSTSTNPPF